eukprot:jgi/Botrbrau1/17899/Bobra.0432s0004.1
MKDWSKIVCQRRGNASSGLPQQLQGICTPSPEEAISWGGGWDPATKTVAVRPGRDPVWAGYDTSSERLANGLWTLSAAALFNSMQTLVWTLNIKFNEDVTFGQMSVGLSSLNLQVPTGYITNWTMSYMPDGRWLRKTTNFGIPWDNDKDIYLTQIIDGNGKPTANFDKWTKARDGRPVAVSQTLHL